MHDLSREAKIGCAVGQAALSWRVMCSLPPP